jgi:hypothetical protein
MTFTIRVPWDGSNDEGHHLLVNFEQEWADVIDSDLSEIDTYAKLRTFYAEVKAHLEGGRLDCIDQFPECRHRRLGQCTHGHGEDCMICVRCDGDVCREDLDEDDICPPCKENA